MKSMKTISYLVCAALTVMSVYANDDDVPPDQLFSPDKNFSVKMLPTPMPGVDADTYSDTLVVMAKDKVLSKQATMGYLLRAFWTADNNYVAVDNRRGNSGDYLWVFSLKNGHALRVPDDNAIQPFVDRVVKKFPECASHDFFKRLTEATSWKSPTELLVKTNISFEKIDSFFVITDTYKVEGAHLVLEADSIEKKPLKL